MDEESNIIIDDERTKRQLHRSKMLRRRNTLVSNALNDFSNDNLSESTSTDDTMETVYNFPHYLLYFLLHAFCPL